ncbi:helix-turn-helix domain-containing protein [Vibrio olivae]
MRDKVEKNRPSNESNLLNSVCSEVNISRWTLYRKLSQENTTFSALLKSVRLDMSLHFLLHSRCSVQEISDRTGFGSSSAFSRFFYTNMGMAPLNYRKVKSQIN